MTREMRESEKFEGLREKKVEKRSFEEALKLLKRLSDEEGIRLIVLEEYTTPLARKKAFFFSSGALTSLCVPRLT